MANNKKQTQKHNIFIRLTEADFKCLPPAGQDRARWIAEAFREKAERERLTKVYAGMDKKAGKK